MASAGTFCAVQGGGEWHEVLLCVATGSDSCHWLCRTTTPCLAFMWAAVRLVPGAVAFASSAGPDRSYAGLSEEAVNWMVSTRGRQTAAWSPGPDEAQRLLAQATKFAALLGAIPPHAYFEAGSPHKAVPSINHFLTTAMQPGQGQFAVILREDKWEEVFLCLPTAPDGEHWLCRTTNWHTFIWSAVRLVQGCFLIAQNPGPNREYPGLDADEVNWICDDSDALQAWNPNAGEAQALVAEAVQILSQMGTIPQTAYAEAGSYIGGIPSLKEVHMQRTELSPGHFCLVRRGEIWKEVLLCKPMPDVQHWLCLTSDYEASVLMYWTAVKLQEGHFWVLPGTGAKRGEACPPVGQMTIMWSPDNPHTVWAPTPKRIRKALSDAEQVAGVLGAIPETSYALATDELPEQHEEQPLPVLHAHA